MITHRVIGRWMPLIALVAALGSGRPAYAGHYELASSDPTSGSGSISSTCSNSSSPFYTQQGSQTLSRLTFGRSTADGAVEASASETWSFNWVPNEGETVETDPPVDEFWSVTYIANVSFGYDPYASVSGSGTGSVTVNPEQEAETTVSGDLHTQPITWDPVTEEQIVTPPTGTNSVEQTIESGFTLSGAYPTITITAVAHGTASGAVNAMGVGLALFAPPAKKADEFINHSTPKKDSTISVAVAPNLTATGSWQGMSGGWLYKVKHTIDAPMSGAHVTFENPTGVAGTGAPIGWSGTSYALSPEVSAVADWYSRAELKRWDGTLFAGIKNSSIRFHVKN